MKDVSRRVVEVWEEEIVPVVRSGKRVMVVVRKPFGRRLFFTYSYLHR